MILGARGSNRVGCMGKISVRNPIDNILKFYIYGIIWGRGSGPTKVRSVFTQYDEKEYNKKYTIQPTGYHEKQGIMKNKVLSREDHK